MTFNPILFYEYGKSRGIISDDLYDEITGIDTLALSIATNDLMWFRPYLASDFPEITCDKKYIFTYSTDHSNTDGEIWWAKGDNLNGSDLVEQGIIMSGYQSESPFLIRIPAAECGDSEVIHLYYQTNAIDPTNASKQQTHLITTTGGLLHTATWTQRGKPLGLIDDENHTGYLKVYRLGVGNYKGIHIRAGAVPQDYVYSTSTNGRTFTRENAFNKGGFIDIGSQYKGITGTIILDKYGNNWALMNRVNCAFTGNTQMSLIKLDANLQPIKYCKTFSGLSTPITLNRVHGDIEVYIEGYTAYIYWSESNLIKMAKYDLRNLIPFQITIPFDTTYPSANIISYYPMTDNVLDSKGVHNGVVVGTPTYNESVSGRDFKLSGANYINLGTNIIGGRSAFSITAMIQLNGIGINGENTIYADWAAPYCTLFRHYGTGNVLQWYIFIGGVQYGGIFYAMPTNTGKVFVCATFDGLKMRMYINDINTGVEFSAVGTVNIGGTTEKIGSWGTRYGKQNIDDVALWNKALSLTEAKGVYYKLVQGQPLI